MTTDILMIRQLGPDDLPVFKCLRLEALRLAPEAYASRIEDWQALADTEWRRSPTEQPVFAAFRGDEPVGLMGLIRQLPSKMAHRASLVMVYVREDARGTGVASRLLDGMVRHARSIGIRQLELAVSAENIAAIRFYLREGFSEIGTIPAGYRIEGQELDEVLMVRRID